MTRPLQRNVWCVGRLCLGAAAGMVAGGAAAVPAGDGDGTSVGEVVVAVLFLAGVAGLVVAALVGRARRRRLDLEEGRAALEPMVDALAAQVGSLWTDPSGGNERAAAQEAWNEAAKAQLDARSAVDRADDRGDLTAARRLIERGLRAAQRTRAILDGKPVPTGDAALLDGLCAFDPGHGRGVDMVEMTTAKGAPAEILVCPACAHGLAQGVQPAVRQVRRSGRPVPYWQGASWSGALLPSLGGAIGGPFLYDVVFEHHEPHALSADEVGYDAGSSDIGDQGH